MRSLAEAAAAVGVARRRLLARAALDGAARGMLLGAFAGAAAWLALRLGGAGDAAIWFLLAPAAGAVLGMARALVRGVTTDVAALSLDAAARTDQAFISAMTATDALPEFRELSADYAVTRCPPSAVTGFLPFRAPGVASSALVASALLAALVLVPRAAEARPVANIGVSDEVPAGAGAAASVASTPRERIEAVRNAIASGMNPTPNANARRDLAALSSSDLRNLAKSLASSPAAAEAAKRALAALDRGDRAAAVDALREALGGGGAVISDTPGGGERAATGAVRDASRPWASGTWPLQYDRVVRRWLAQTPAPEAGK